MGAQQKARSDSQFNVEHEGVPKQRCLIADIEDAINRVQATRIEVPQAGWLWIDPADQCFWGRVHDPETFFATPSGQADIRPAGIPREKHPGRPLEELLWDAAFVGSGGRLFDGQQLHDLVELSHWPNLTRVRHMDSCYALSAFLSSRPSTLHLAFHALHVPKSEAVRFYNAALASGCLRILQSRSQTGGQLKGFDSPASGSKEARVLPFWARLFARVSGL